MLSKTPSLTEAQIFNENTIAFAQRGLFAEVTPKSPSWDSWRAYFRLIEHRSMLRIMAAHEDRTWLGKHGMMVPTEWPDDFDARARRLPPPRQEPERFETAEHRSNVVSLALRNAGFTPREYRRTKPVAAHELKGEVRDRRLREIAALEEHAANLASQPLPPLSDAAKAALNKGEPAQ